MKQIITILVAVSFAAIAHAAPKIKQIDTNKKRVAVSATSKTTIGSEWVATDKNGTQCTMKVVDKMANIAIMKAKSCSNLSKLRVGQMVTKSLFSENAQNVSGQTESKGIQDWDTIRENLKGFSLIGFYSMASEFPAKAGNTSGTYQSESSFGFGAEYEYGLGEDLIQGLPLSVVGGLTYEMSREITGIKVNGQTQQFQEKPTVALWTFYANGQVHLTERLSGFGGLNYGIPMEKKFGNDKAKSGIGYQIGASAKLTSSLAVDGVYRWINFKTDQIDEIDLDGFVVRGRYLF